MKLVMVLLHKRLVPKHLLDCIISKHCSFSYEEYFVQHGQHKLVWIVQINAQDLKWQELRYKHSNNTLSLFVPANASLDPPYQKGCGALCIALGYTTILTLLFVSIFITN